MQGEKVYISVIAEFNPATGTMMPKSLTWEDGSRYDIERVVDVRPAASAKAGGQGDRYTVLISGKPRCLYFEHNPIPYSMDLGKWFVERRQPRQ